LSKEYWGIDAEGISSGLEWTKEDIHSIQVCPNTSEQKGIMFTCPERFKEWLTRRQKYGSRPKIFYAFTLPFEYGTLLGWELLNIEQCKNWQHWTDAPINLFYITLGKVRIPVIDIRIFFHQLRHGNNYLTSLAKLGDYLSEYYGEDIHKLDNPLGEAFGKRRPTSAEMQAFEKYAVRDSFITAKGAQWIHENVIDIWLKGEVSIKRLFSWGTVAKHYFNLPKLNRIYRYANKIVVEFPNLWHEQIFDNTFAGRSESFYTGNVGSVYYNDVSSLYPVSMIQTQCMLIKNVREWRGDVSGLHGPFNWKKFHDETDYPYGWIRGDFRSENDLWGIPIKLGVNNIYATGKVKNALYHTLDLEASNVEVLDVNAVLIPEFDDSQKERMKKFETLTMKKVQDECASEIEKYCIKNTINSASGILGKARPNFSDTTNLCAYNTLLAESHLAMSRIFHSYDSPDHPIFYTDTDSFFWDYPVEKVIEQCEPYPSLPYQTIDAIPLEVGLRSDSWERGTVIFRGKMYYQNVNSLAFSGWKPFPQFFTQIIHTKPLEVTVERQVTRKWRTRDRKATVLKTGRWFVAREKWNIEKLKQIFRADTKRNRTSYDSYQLFLDDQNQPSKSWTTTELTHMLQERKWMA